MLTSKEIKNRKNYFIKDESLRDVDNDSFNHRDISRVICNIIDSTEPPYNIAIIGKWGLGKSSLINMALGKYENNSDYIVHEINAWKYEKEALTKVFLKQLWEGVDGQKIKTFEKIKQRYADIINAINKPNMDKSNIKINKKIVNVCLSILGGSIILFIFYKLAQAVVNNINIDLNYWLNIFISYCRNVATLLLLPLFLYTINIYFTEIIENGKRNVSFNIDIQSADEYEMLLEDKINERLKSNADFKIITVIDDLDRLSLNKIVEALDAIKAFVGFNRCIFIVPFDDAILKKALEENKINGLQSDNEIIESELILDKLFQYKIYLPPILKYDIKEYAVDLVLNNLPDFLNDYCNEKNMNDLIKNVLIHSGVSTPRQVKKIINIFITNCIIAYKREVLKKVDNDVLKSDSALKQIAKISVLQADFNEFYDLLFKNFNYINLLLKLYNNDEKGIEDIPEDLMCYFEILDEQKNKIKLKKEHIDLINYLSWTNKYQTDHIEQFMYLAQEEISKKTGDENFRKLINAIESNNIKLVIEMIDDNHDNIEILNYKLENSFDYDIPETLIIAINVFHLCSNSYKTKFANNIAGKSEDLKMVNTIMNYIQLSAENLTGIYEFAENKDFSGNLLRNYINSLKQDNIEIEYLVLSVSKLLEEESKLSDDFGNLITNLCKNIYSDYNNDIIQLLNIAEQYYDKPNVFMKYFGINMFNRIVYELDENNMFEEKILAAFNKTFSVVVKNIDINLLIESMLVLFDYPKLLDIINELLISPYIGSISKNNATSIVNKIISIEFDEDSIPDSAVKLIEELNFDITEGMENNFDLFMNNIIKNNSSDKIEHLLIYTGENELFEFLENTIKSITDMIFISTDFNNIISKIESYFTEDQKTQLRDSLMINSRYNNYSNYDSNHLIDIYEILSKNRNNSDFINICIKDILSQFDSYYREQNYFDFVSELMGHIHKEIDETNLEKYINIIVKIFSSYINNSIKAIQRVQDEIKDEQWDKIIPLLINNVSSSNYEMIFDIIEDNSDYFTKEKGNLKEHISFLVDTMGISHNPNDNLKSLERNYISISKIDELIEKCTTIKDIDNNIANRVVRKFIENMEVTEIGESVINALKDKNLFDFVSNILTQIKKYKIDNIIDTVSKKIDSTTPIENIDRLIKFCLKNKQNLTVETVLSIISIGLENVDEITAINNICNQLSQFGKEYFAKYKNELASVIYKCYHNTNSGKVKISLLRIVSELKIRRQFRSLLNEKEQVYYQSNID